MQMRCKRCGETIPAYYCSRGLCDDCKWDTWIPPGHQRREEYKFDPAWGHANATRRPRLGTDFLDHRQLMPSDVLPMCLHRPKGLMRT